MTDLNGAPFYRSYLLNRTIYLHELKSLSNEELHMLNVDTLAALNEARFRYDQIEDKQSEAAGGEFRRIKVAGYFQAAIGLELQN